MEEYNPVPAIIVATVLSGAMMFAAAWQSRKFDRELAASEKRMAEDRIRIRQGWENIIRADQARVAKMQELNADLGQWDFEL